MKLRQYFYSDSEKIKISRLSILRGSQQDYIDSEVMLRVEKLSKVYVSSMGRVVSLKNVCFSVNKGEFVSVVGPSGSGKSTLLNMIGALDRPTSGKVFLDGLDIFSLNDSQIAAVKIGRASCRERV